MSSWLKLLLNCYYCI